MTRAVLFASRNAGSFVWRCFFAILPEIIRQHQRAINKSIREMDREKMRLEAEEQKIIREIKKMAKEGQMVNAHACVFVC